MKNNIIKIICLVICLMMLIPFQVKASTENIDIYISDASEANPGGSSSSSSSGSSGDITTSDYKPSPTNSTKFNTIIGKILGVLQIICAILTVIGIAVIGFFIMTGSADEKASAKGKAIGILAGIVITFGIISITKIFITAAEG